MCAQGCGPVCACTLQLQGSLTPLGLEGQVASRGSTASNNQRKRTSTRPATRSTWVTGVHTYSYSLLGVVAPDSRGGGQPAPAGAWQFQVGHRPRAQARQWCQACYTDKDGHMGVFVVGCAEVFVWECVCVCYKEKAGSTARAMNSQGNEQSVALPGKRTTGVCVSHVGRCGSAGIKAARRAALQI